VYQKRLTSSQKRAYVTDRQRMPPGARTRCSVRYLRSSEVRCAQGADGPNPPRLGGRTNDEPNHRKGRVGRSTPTGLSVAPAFRCRLSRRGSAENDGCSCAYPVMATDCVSWISQ
jgi:hypothetical protein